MTSLENFSSTWDQYTIAPLPITASYGRSVNTELDRKAPVDFKNRGYYHSVGSGTDIMSTNALIGEALSVAATFGGRTSDYYITQIDFAIRQHIGTYLAELSGCIGLNNEAYDADYMFFRHLLTVPVKAPRIADPTIDGHIFQVNLGCQKLTAGSYITIYADATDSPTMSYDYFRVHYWLPD